NRDETLTIMTNGGGAGVMAADAAAACGVVLREPGMALRAKLNAMLPPTWSHGNPIDIIGDAPVRRYTETLQALLGDREAGAILLLHAPTAIVRSDDIALACAPIVRQAAGRVMSCWLGDASVAEARRVFEAGGAAAHEMPMAREAGPPDIAAARVVIDAALAAGRELLDESESKVMLKAYGIPVVDTVATEPSGAAAAAAARALGYPAALNNPSPAI